MRFRLLMLAAVVTSPALAWVDAAPVAAKTEMSRQEIRSMPIETRPYRMGHFYGNTVRRRGR
jgi:hypothetical protein